VFLNNFSVYPFVLDFSQVGFPILFDFADKAHCSVLIIHYITESNTFLKKTTSPFLLSQCRFAGFKIYKQACSVQKSLGIGVMRVQDVNARMEALDKEVPQRVEVDREQLMALAEDLPLVWYSETSDMRVKQRIVRLLLEEIIVDIDERAAQIAMTLHWRGGRHSELRIQRPKPGNSYNATRTDALEIVKRMAGQWPDKEIAATLNRRGMKTGVGNTWTESRVYSLRRKHRLLDYSPPVDGEEILTLNQAADRLGVGAWVVRRLIKVGILEASQVVRSAPWQIKSSAVESEKIREAAKAVKSRKLGPGSINTDDRNLTIPGI
jgi:hypothetical protein